MSSVTVCHPCSLPTQLVDFTIELAGNTNRINFTKSQGCQISQLPGTEVHPGNGSNHCPRFCGSHRWGNPITGRMVFLGPLDNYIFFYQLSDTISIYKYISYHTLDQGVLDMDWNPPYWLNKSRIPYVGSPSGSWNWFCSTLPCPTRKDQVATYLGKELLHVWHSSSSFSNFSP